MSTFSAGRRRFLRGAGLAVAAAPLAGCDAFDGLLQVGSPLRGVLGAANELTYRAQRALIGADTLAPEFSESEIRQGQRPNGSTNPQDHDYLALEAKGFATYRLEVSGMVERPLALGLRELRAMPARSQITRHDCVEGWSCIARWTGVQLSRVLDAAGAKPGARYVVFHCFDTLENGFQGPIRYYESIDMIDARHPQTILAYGLNGASVPVSNGAPLRVRVERQLGYKMAKYIREIEVVADLSSIRGGKGGYWEDRGYDWFAGI